MDRLVGLGVDSKEKADHDATALRQAVLGGHVAMLGRFIELGVDQNETTNDGWTTVHMAAQHGNISVTVGAIASSPPWVLGICTSFLILWKCQCQL